MLLWKKQQICSDPIKIMSVAIKHDMLFQYVKIKQKVWFPILNALVPSLI